ncbi:MAG: transposase [Patescibacteria group bacterium]|nr:transposase [Patescibacteria group bacterium]MDD5490737.1 transposase [Patescibacteria group bacterium]
MFDLFQNKYRIQSTRLEDWDYSQDGYYFVTICTQNKRCLFGEIKDEEMILNGLGRIAVKCWLEIPQHSPFVLLDEFIVMPNHIHGIIVIKNNNGIKRRGNVIQNNNVNRDKNDNSVETRHGVSLQDENKSKFNKFSVPIPGSLPTIVNQYKSSVKRWCNKNGYLFFTWQPLYYDHIIRDDEELYNVRNYIISNPEKWERDRNNPANMVKYKQK